MSKWIEACKAKYYDESGSKKEYIKCLLSKIRTQAGRKRLQERGIVALFELTMERGRNTPIPVHDVRRKSGISGKQSQSSGLWGWVEAGVVDCLYMINEDSIEDMEKVLGDQDG